MHRPNGKPTSLSGEALRLNDLFDEIENLLDACHLPGKFPASLNKARFETVSQLVAHDLMMTGGIRSFDWDTLINPED